MTVKSDDVVGRVKTYEAIVKGQNIPRPGIPESFKVLIKELQSLGLDIKVLDKDEKEIDLKQTFDDDDNMGLTPVGKDFHEDEVVTSLDGFTLEDDPDDNNMFDESSVVDDADEDFDDELNNAFDDADIPAADEDF